MSYKFTYLLLLVTLFSFSQNLEIPVDTVYTTNHTTKIKGQTINYKAMTGFQPVWNTDGEVMASLYYTYYKRLSLLVDSRKYLQRLYQN